MFASVKMSANGSPSIGAKRARTASNPVIGIAFRLGSDSSRLIRMRCRRVPFLGGNAWVYLHAPKPMLRGDQLLLQYLRGH